MSTRTVLVIPVTWTGLPSTTVATSDITTVFSTVATDFGTISYGNFATTATVVPWQTITAPTVPDLNVQPSLIRSAEAAASAAGYTPSSYDRVVITDMHGDGSRGGESAVPGRYTWIWADVFKTANQPVFGPATVLHEMGHTFGLNHAHGVFVTDGASSPVQSFSSLGFTGPLAGSQIAYPSGPVLSATYGYVDYGDKWSVMSGNFSMTMGCFHRMQLGWLASTRVTSLTRGQGVTLVDNDTTSGTAAAFIHPSATRSYLLEYPAPTGLKVGTAGFATGVHVQVLDYTARFGENEHYGYPFLLDTKTAATGQDAGIDPFTDALIPANTAWQTPEGWTIHVGAVSAGVGAAVSIS